MSAILALPNSSNRKTTKILLLLTVRWRAVFRNLLMVGSVLGASPFLFAQTGTVRGVVRSGEDGNSIPFAKVVVMGTDQFATTDIDGLFSIPKVPKGEHTVRITATQFEQWTTTVFVNADQITAVRAEMKKGKMLGTIVVEQKTDDRAIDPATSVHKIDKKAILRVPVIGGVSDIASYFQTVPGVVSTGDQGGQVYVRGGTPIQNKILLDGMTIYNPFHSIGFFSVFETDLIQSADIYTGGFNAKYGGRISSVMDIRYRDGNAKHFSGALSVSPFMSNLLLEGPLSKANNISFILSGKAALLEQTSKALYPYINRDEKGVTGGLPFNFWDLYGKVTLKGQAANSLSLVGFSFNDQVNYQAVSDLKWTSYGGGTHFIFVPQHTELFLKGRLNFSNYTISLEEENVQPRTSGIFGGELAFDFTYFLPNKTKLDYGFGFSYFSTEFNTFNEVNRPIEQNDNTIEAGAYVSYRSVSKNRKWIVEPSFRLQAYSSVGQVTAEPRISAKYNVNEVLRLKTAGGYYTQNFTATTSDKDVVNLFYGFITAPTNLPETFTEQDGSQRAVNNGLQKAWHGVVGLEVDLTQRLKMNVEGYAKSFRQLTNINRNKIFDDNTDNSKVEDVLKKDFIVENGTAWGGDVVFTYTAKQLYLWGAYSLGKVIRWDGFVAYAPVFDRRHSINLIATYTFGRGKSWEASMRWNLGTGLPFKQTKGVFEQPAIEQIDEDYTTANASELSFYYEEMNTGRLSAYHRLDAHIKKNVQLSERLRTRLEIVAGVTNVYSRNNIFYVDRITNEKVFQLPIMPSLAVHFRF